MIDREQERYERGLAAEPIPRPDYEMVPPRAAEETWPSGIFEPAVAPYPAMVYRFENQWQADIGGAHVQVYAGALAQDLSQGIVVVRTSSLDLKEVSSHEFKTPEKAGLVRIEAADGDQLTLISADGTTFYFDVGGRQFVAR